MKKRKSYNLKEISEIIAIISVACAAGAFLLRGYWYLYEWGYYNSIGLSRLYIDVESAGTIYYVLTYMGLAGLMIFSNYLVYFLCKNRYARIAFVIEAVETVILVFVVLVTSNVTIQEAVEELKEYGLQKMFEEVLLKLFILVVVINLYGMIYGMYFRYSKSGTLRETDDDWKKYISFSPQMGLLFLIIIIFEGFITFYIGADAGNDKKDYKIIVENIVLEDGEKVQEKYIFTLGDSKMRIYPILYEDEERFIISMLCKKEDEIIIESAWQKVIAKEGIETIYCKDIFSLNKDEQKEEDKETELVNTETKKGNKMVETLLGVVVGAGCTYFIEDKKRKKDKINEERHAARLLYYDLSSIEQYLKEEKGLVNLRYFNDWQNVMANCSFLSKENVMYLYRIYDEVYNFNDTFSRKILHEKFFKKEKIDSYEKLKVLIFNEKKVNNVTDEYNSKYKEIRHQLEIKMYEQ